MTIKTGIDLVYLPKFQKSLESGGENFLRRIFHDTELEEQDGQRLAGIFAAKEAVIKALSLPQDSWKYIAIKYQPTGAPRVELLSGTAELQSHDLSISHDGRYVVAQFVAVLRNDGSPS